MTTLENSTVDYRSREAPKSRYCSCQVFEKITDSLSANLADTPLKLNAFTVLFQASMSPTTIGRMPTSCEALQRLGHKNSGIFLVKANQQVENVDCDFTKRHSDTDFQIWIGKVDIKTTRVSFHDQRDPSRTMANLTVPFDRLRTNVGNAMNKTTGIFIAPVTGTYFFGLSTEMAIVELQKKTATDDWHSIVEAYGSAGQFDAYGLQATLRLDRGDGIRLFLAEGNIFDSRWHNTNFIGFLLEEGLK